MPRSAPVTERPLLDREAELDAVVEGAGGRQALMGQLSAPARTRPTIASIRRRASALLVTA
jgi:hypothetical protein